MHPSIGSAGPLPALGFPHLGLGAMLIHFGGGVHNGSGGWSGWARGVEVGEGVVFCGELALHGVVEPVPDDARALGVADGFPD